MFGIVPLHATGVGYVEHILPLVLATEIWLMVLNHRSTTDGGPTAADSRAVALAGNGRGVAPIYMKATLQAILSGPNRKPIYTVTRKHDDLRWHWRHTLPQTAVVPLVPLVGIYSLLHGTLPGVTLLASTVHWGGLNIVLLTSFVTRGWHGVFRSGAPFDGQRPARDRPLQSPPTRRSSHRPTAEFRS